MRIGVFAYTTAQLYFYNNIIKGLENDGHEVILVARDYREIKEVADELGLNLVFFSTSKVSPIEKITSVPFDTLKAINQLKKFKVDLTTGFGLYNTYSAVALGIPDITFGDSEPNVNKMSYSIQYKMFMPFVKCYVTPMGFKQNMGERHIRVDSYKEIAYLHPKYFKPDIDVIKDLDLIENEYAVLRFNSFDAVHDIGKKGFSDSDKIQLVDEMEKYVKVVISSEKGVPEELHDRVLTFPRSKIHSILAFARVLLCDTQTMATEAALLGTPTIRYNSFVGKNDMSNFIELEEKYGLIYNHESEKGVFNSVKKIFDANNIKEEWANKRDILMREKIDITSFMVWLIENYPESYFHIKEYPESQYKFSSKIGD